MNTAGLLPWVKGGYSTPGPALLIGPVGAPPVFNGGAVSFPFEGAGPLYGLGDRGRFISETVRDSLPLGGIGEDMAEWLSPSLSFILPALPRGLVTVLLDFLSII